MRGRFASGALCVPWILNWIVPWILILTLTSGGSTEEVPNSQGKLRLVCWTHRTFPPTSAVEGMESVCKVGFRKSLSSSANPQCYLFWCSGEPFFLQKIVLDFECK